MKKAAVLALFLALESGHLAAQRTFVPGGSLTDIATGRACPLEHTDVHGEVTGVVASMEVTQVFRNPFDSPIEARYVFPLPHTAAVHDMEVRVGKRRIRADIERRETARERYEAARTAGHLSALVEEERPNVFTQSVANILPGETVRVTLRYFEELLYDSGEYELVFPMVVGPRFVPTDGSVPDADRISPPVAPPGLRAGHDIALSVDIRAGSGFAAVTSPSHAIDVDRLSDGDVRVRLSSENELPNQDFVLRYGAVADELDVIVLTHRAAEGADGYFIVGVHASPSAAEGDVPREVIFIVDSSGSMSGAPIAHVRQAMKRALRSLGPRDRFQIVRFSNRAETFAPRPVLATRDAVQGGLDYVSRLSGNGGTIMLDGVRAAIEQPHDPELVRVIVFLTDGYIGNEAAILDYLSRNVGEARLFSFGVGSSVNRFLIDEMAAIGRGRAEVLLPAESPEASMDRLFEGLRRPALTDLELDWGGLQVSDVYPEHVPDLFFERPVVVLGRYREAGAGELVLKGRRADESYEKRVHVSFPRVHPDGSAIAKLWAKTRITALSRRAQWKPDADVEEAITRIALEHRLVTAYTAFVAVEERFLDGQSAPTLVEVPVELPAGVSYEGVFGVPGGMSFSTVDVWNHMGFSAKLVNFVLFLMSVAALSVLVERSWTLVRSSPAADIEAAERAARAHGLDRSARRRTMERTVRTTRYELSRGVRNLLTIGITAPLVGLAGMVSGLLNAFRGLALTATGGIGAVSAGIAEALVPLAMGLAIGLVAVWGYAYLVGRIDKTAARMTKRAASSE